MPIQISIGEQRADYRSTKHLSAAGAIFIKEHPVGSRCTSALPEGSNIETLREIEAERVETFDEIERQQHQGFSAQRRR